MSNLTVAGGSNAVAALAGLKQGLQNVATSIVTTGGDPFLRLLKDGIWVYGAENVEVEPNSEWAVNPLSIMHGWVAWSDYKKKSNEILGEVMVPANHPLPLRTSLQDVVDDEGNKGEWVQQLSMQFQCMTGEDTGEQVKYKVTSVGGMNATKALIGSIMAQLEKDIDRPVPLVVLGSSHYNHKTYGKTYVPEFEIVEWIALDEAIKAPIADTPDSDTKAEATPAEAQRVRERQSAPADQTQGITPEDRRAAIDAAMQEQAAARSERRAAAASQPAEEAGPRRRQRR